MPVLLPNALLSTARRTYDPVTAITSPVSPYLPPVPAHIAALSSKQLSVLPEDAFGSDYSAVVDSGTNVAIGDEIPSITLLDGLTPWPGDVIPPGNANAPNIVWRVKYIQEASPGLLPYRKLYLKRVINSGPTGKP